MCFLSVGLDTLGLLLRVWLWISVPVVVILLCVGTWMNYLRTSRSKGGLRLAVDGVGGEIRPGALGGEVRPGALDGDRMIGLDDLVGEGSETMAEAGSETIVGEERVDESDREELTATGRETIYQGILWMKEKFEEYREQADQRYELLREELGRSERRYQELLGATEQSKNQVLETVTDKRQDPEVDLEGQLRTERLKVAELVKKLRANTELILRIYKELEGIPDLGK